MGTPHERQVAWRVTNAAPSFFLTTLCNDYPAMRGAVQQPPTVIA
jgi:hypothetical protein